MKQMIADGPRQPSREAADIMELSGGFMDGKRIQIRVPPPQEYEIMRGPKWKVTTGGGEMVEPPTVLSYKKSGRVRIERTGEQCHNVHVYEFMGERELELLPEDKHWP